MDTQHRSGVAVTRAGAGGPPAVLLQNEIRPYPWGSTTAIPELLGVEPTGEPQAELWMGAHPGAPSRLRHGTAIGAALPTLLSQVEADPAGELGGAVVSELGTRLPFLLKVLAVERPVSLQAHPSTEQARAGYAEEDRQGVPIGARHRNYRDTCQKPELLCALTQVEALCGFRGTPRTVRLLGGLDVPGLAPYADALRARPDSEGLREVVTGLLTMPASARRRLVTAVTAACQRAATAAGSDGMDAPAVADVKDGPDRPHAEFAAEYRWGARLGEWYPDDIGVVTALLMNLVRLRPGEAVFLPSGNLHSYLFGLGVEIMANSDNVLRGGLTSKHVDVPELLRILDFGDGPEFRPPVRRLPTGEELYQAPVKEFRLSRLRLRAGSPVTLDTPDTSGPQILLVADGEVWVTGRSGRLSLPRGASAYVSAGRPPVTVSGDGLLFRATTNVPARE
ncbi:MAG TPA: mannose-6-phosphate isomerase, class I [Mycobacteriales bacterium]|nr:mannose-6-phosphate isomerase, class I [Mycobacteriales bacterium]